MNPLTCKKKCSMDTLMEMLPCKKEEGKSIVLCYGAFDLLHIGHIRHLEQARRMGDLLVAVIIPDHFLKRGGRGPLFDQALRIEALSALNCVDYVAVNPWPTSRELLKRLKPHKYLNCTGKERGGQDIGQEQEVAHEMEILSQIGSEKISLSDTTFNSTSGINLFFSSFPHEVQEYLKLFRCRFDCEFIFEILDAMSRLNVLLVGDTILDDYHYCNVLGTSSKEPVIAVQYRSNDLFAGGVLAIANHLADFAGRVRLMTVLGEKDSHEEFIRSKLHQKVSPYFMYQDGAPTIIKRRFIEGYSLNKLFEVYIMDDSGLSPEKDNAFLRQIREEISQYDVVIAADFGHGAISRAGRELLVKHAPFLAVNTQANAGNRGFHTVSCYPGADFVSLAEHELRMETRSQSHGIQAMLDLAADRMKSKYFIVTRGRKGCMVRNGEGRFIEVPAFAHKVIDRIGAGDAFLSITAMAAALNCPPEVVGFLGNVVGAIAVEYLGNQHSVEKRAVKEYIASLLR